MLSDAEGERPGSGVVSGKASGERPSFARPWFVFSLFLFSLSLLSWRCFFASFRSFRASAYRLFATRISGSEGSEVYPW